MKHMKRLAAITAAGALVIAVSGIASAASVTPTFHDGNITVDGNGNSAGAACDADDALFLNGGDSPDTSGTTTNGVTITVTYHSGDNGFDFVAEGGLVTIAYVKGADGYFEYNYGAGVASDTDLSAPDAGGSGGAAVVSHLVFCTAAEAQSSSSSSSASSSSSSSSASSTASETSSSSESHTQTVSGTSTSSSPTEPNTATIGETGSSNGSSAAWLLLAALGALFGSVVVLAPSRAKNKE